MSRVGKKIIEIPQVVQVAVAGQEVQVQGPKGELKHTLPVGFSIKQENNTLEVMMDLEGSGKGKKTMGSLWGLERSLVSNMIVGVTQGYEKRLQLEGTGYRASVEGAALNLSLGFSHPVELQIPEGLQCSVDKNIISISGIDKQQVGEFAASIRRLRPVEPYKGKGVRYEGEVVRRKEGKKAAGAAGP